MFSGKNNLTFIAEQTIQPFIKRNKYFTIKEMHLYKIPWLKKVLKSLQKQIVIQFKFTLSYFIEPSPGERGNKNKYPYPSFGLRFALIKPQENEQQFIDRINKTKKYKNTKSTKESDNRWVLGKKNINMGSIHSDYWKGTTQDIAKCNLMAVYPINDWWKEQKKLNKTRYSLIISLSTPKENIDLYTPCRSISDSYFD